jgi:DNA repair exonuclease SbcCD ATPase subunit
MNKLNKETNRTMSKTFRTATELGEILGVHSITIRRTFNKHSEQLEKFLKQGPRKTKMLSEEAIPLLADLMEITYETNGTSEQTKQELEQLRQQLSSSNNLNKILTEQNEHLKNQQIKEQENRDRLQNDLRELQYQYIESQKRSDTIIMSLSQRIEEVQKKLPAPEEKPKKGVIKRFIAWLTEPDKVIEQAI